MGRIDTSPGGLHQRNRPIHEVAPIPPVTPEAFMRAALARMTSSLSGLARRLDDLRYPVDEYVTQSLVADSVTSLEVLPQYDRWAERIESIVITGPPGSSQGTPQATEGSGTSLAANTTFATIANALPGTYLCYWWFGLDGTVSATDQDNAKLTVSGVLVDTAVNDPVAGHYEQAVQEITIPQGGAPVSMKTVAATTVGATYSGQISLIPITGQTPFQLQLGDRVWNLNMPVSGILPIAPLSMLLNRNDRRVLTSATPGQWSVELMGWADERY